MKWILLLAITAIVFAAGIVVGLRRVRKGRK